MEFPKDPKGSLITSTEVSLDNPNGYIDTNNPNLVIDWQAHEDADKKQLAIEYYLREEGGPRLVHRSVHVQLKKGLAVLPSAGSFG